jgi:hypothetical protein
MWHRWVAGGMVTTVLMAGCSGPGERPGSRRAGVAVSPDVSARRVTSGAPSPPFEVTASLQELMRDEVDSSADAIWDAVGTTTTRDGIVEKQPRSDEHWQALRRHAVVLLEATNLLVIPGRRVAVKEIPFRRARCIQLARDPNGAGAPAAGVRRIFAGLARYGPAGAGGYRFSRCPMHF